MAPGKKVGLFISCLVLLLIGTFLLPVSDWIVTVLHWTGTHPKTSWLLFILTYVLATVMLLPGSILTLGAGFLFNLPAGIILVSISSTTGACLAFLIGRFLARDWITGKISGMQRFKALDRAVSGQGFLIVFLTRLSPIFPFNLLNYGLGLTGVKFSHYLLASWIGMLPGTIMYVYIGSAAQSLTALAGGHIQAGDGSRIVLFTGLIATVILTLLITRIATRSLRGRLD